MILTTFEALTLLRLDLNLRRALLDLGLNKLVNGASIFVGHLLRLELSRLLLNQIATPPSAQNMARSDASSKRTVAALRLHRVTVKR